MRSADETTNDAEMSLASEGRAPSRARSWLAPLFLVLTGAGWSEAGTRRALLVAIDKYRPPQAAAGSPVVTGARGAWTNLDGAVNDELALRELLVARFGFEAANVLVLTNGEATREGILAAYRRHLIDGVQPGDTAVFFYAGHGSRVRNSLTDEPDGMDETLVPADSYRGTPDLRDKELNRLFMLTLDKGAGLTVIADSCHSGSIARGLARPVKVRSLPPDERDVKLAPDDSPKAEDRGALVLSAAQDHQFAGETSDDEGNAHGAFSLALIKALQVASPADTAQDVFLRLKALMQSEGASQEPVLAGLPRRRQQPLFDAGAVDAVSTRVAVLRRLAGDRVLLQGGIAVGLQAGCELRTIAGPSPLRLRVTRVLGVVTAEAQVVEGHADGVAAGDLFEVDRWTWGDSPLRVWWPTLPPSRAQLGKVIERLRRLQQAAELTWVADPTADSPTHVLSWNGSLWELRGPDGIQAMGAMPSSRQVLKRLGTGPERPRLFLQLPPDQDLVSQLQKSLGGFNDAVAIANKATEAHYLLVGRLAGDRAEYAWVMPNASQAEAGSAGFALPIRADWVADATLLEARVLGLRRLRAWLQLQPPPERGARFPYRLALRSAEAGDRTDGVVRAGEAYGLVLRATAEGLGGGVERRYVYVFAIDGFGNGTLLFPRLTSGNVENRVPFESSRADGFPVEIGLGAPRLFTVGPPFGVDTYVLLSTARPIPDPSVLDFRGVRTRGQLPGTENPLARLLTAVGSGSRGAHVDVPADWSIDRLTVRSVPSLE